jgi:hypothetical protein
VGKRTQAASPAVPKPPGGAQSLVWVQGLLCGALATLATPTALLLAVLLAPALVALAFDRAPGRPVARSVALCGLAACVEPVRTLWAAGHELSTAIALLADLTILGIAWTAGAAGWLLAELSPIGVRAVLEALSLTRAAKLRSARARLVEEWGFSEPPAQ